MAAFPLVAAPLWLFCNECTAQPNHMDTDFLHLTECGHIFCKKCIASSKTCRICDRPTVVQKNELMDQKNSYAEDGDLFFKDTAQLIKSLAFQFDQMDIALKNISIKGKQQKCMCDNTKDDLIREENRYWKGLFKSSYTVSTPKVQNGTILTPPSTNKTNSGLALSSSSDSLASPKETKHRRPSESKEQRIQSLLKKELQSVKDEKVKLADELNQIKKDSKVVAGREGVLLQQVATLTAQLETIKCEMKALKSKNNMFQEENEVLKALVNDGKTQIELANKDIDKLAGDLNRKDYLLTQNASHMAELLHAEKKSHSVISSLQREVADKGAELDNLTKVIETLNKKIEKCNMEALSKEEELNNLLEQKCLELKLLESRQTSSHTPKRTYARTLSRQTSNDNLENAVADTSRQSGSPFTDITPPQQSPAIYLASLNVRRTPWRQLKPDPMK